jgi:siroheme synthase-like protein
MTRRRVVVVGAGRVAARKVARLLAAEAEVFMVAPEACPELAERAAAGELTWARRPARIADLHGADLLVLAADDEEANAQLALAAAQRGIWVNRADVRGGGDFQIPAESAHGDLRVFVSTGGRSPKLARRLREWVAGELPGWGHALESLAALREELAQRGLDPEARRTFWERFPDDQAWDALRRGEDCREEVEACVSSLSA